MSEIPHARCAAAALAVLEGLGLRESATAGTLAMLAGIIDRETAVGPAGEINARAHVRHANVERGAHVVTVTLTCTSAPAAGDLFAKLAAAISDGKVTLAVPRAAGGRP